MREFIYYVETRSSSLSPKRNVFWKLNNEYCLAVSEDAKHEAALCATFCNKKDWPIELPKPFDNEKIKRITKEVYHKYFNANFEELQKVSFHDGEYYLDKDDGGSSITFHAFFRQPSRHYSLRISQDFEYPEVFLEKEMSLVYRRGIANHCKILSEEIFRQAFKLALEFFYDGSAICNNLDKLWETLDLLSSPNAPDEPVQLNEEYYYLRARELMLNRKEEIKLRLLELDDIPSKRRELRAEMKGIDYCVSILDKNH